MHDDDGLRSRGSGVRIPPSAQGFTGSKSSIGAHSPDRFPTLNGPLSPLTDAQRRNIGLVLLNAAEEWTDTEDVGRLFRSLTIIMDALEGSP